jgi:protease I
MWAAAIGCPVTYLKYKRTKRSIPLANQDIQGLRVAIIATDGVEQVELLKPREALDQAGAKTTVISPKDDKIRGWNFTDWGVDIKVDLPLKRARPEDFDALHIPGGVINPDKLRMIPEAVNFVKAFFDAGKPVGAICHGPWLVIEAGAARGRRIASWPSLKTDVRNAGADWRDEPVVNDGNLVTSRNPDDIPQYNRGIIELYSKMRDKVKQPAA